MVATIDQLKRFHEFALNRLNQGVPAPDFDELVTLWYDSEQRTEIDAIIRQGFADLEAGLGRPAREATAEISRKLGLPPE